MQQILQNIKTGAIEVAELPAPANRKGQVLINTSCSLVSAGTERMMIEFGKAGWISKAKQQPDKVRMVLDKVKTDGIMPTLNSVLNKLDQPLALGYCNVGVVIEASDVDGLSVGDRVVSNGKHAEVVCIPKNLCVKVPDNVTNEAAAFTVIGAIGLQAIRLVAPSLGETIVVTGLGLIGLMTVQLLRAHGCRVLGIDMDSNKLELARQFGAEVVNIAKGEDPLSVSHKYTRGRGVDAVIITASTKSNDPVHQAALMCRKRGRIVLVGVTGLELSRADFYEKELSFQVSCSYGPGRYDSNYEEKGHDYPFGFVRWTEQRNFEAVLDMMADGRVDVKPLISHNYAIEDAQKAYELVGSDQFYLGIILNYKYKISNTDNYSAHQTTFANAQTKVVKPSVAKISSEDPSNNIIVSKNSIAFIGAGNYAIAVLIPAFKAANARLRNISSNGGVSGFHAIRKFGFEATTTDTQSIFADSNVNAVVITTRHDSHASYVCRALESGQNVFVEKPLALKLAEIEQIEQCYKKSQDDGNNPIVMVGFNRRFAPHVQKIKSLISSEVQPKSFVMTVNAGAIPAEHWTQQNDIGGGRLIGEACHFIDLLRFLAGCQISEHTLANMDSVTRDTFTIQLKFTDGSIGSIHYFANGPKSFPKERLEVFVGGRVLQLDNFRKLTGFGYPLFKKMNLWRQDKGQNACVKAFLAALETNGAAPITFSEVIEVSKVTLSIAAQFS